MRSELPSRGHGEAFMWGLFLSLFGVLIVAILWGQFDRVQKPLLAANVGAAVGTIGYTFIWALATSPASPYGY